MKKLIISCLFIAILVIACQANENEDTAVVTIAPAATEDRQNISSNQTSPLPTPTHLRTDEIDSVQSASPIPSPTTNPPDLPTPTPGKGAIYGMLIDDITGLPSSGIPVYLATFDGMLVEISVNNSPYIYTDENGYFFFTDIPPNDDTFRYSLGIILIDQGTILRDPKNDSEILFNVEPDTITNLGTFDNPFR
jgi:hypothetical protein